MKTDAYLVRAARHADISSLVRMRVSLQEHIVQGTPSLARFTPKGMVMLAESYARLVDAPNTLLLVAQEESGRLVGTALGRLMEHPESETALSGRVDDVWVDADCRGGGICSRLIGELTRYFADNGASEVVLAYAVGNDEARSVWTRLGFEPISITAKAATADLQRRLREPGS